MGKIQLKTDEEIELIRLNCLMVSDTLTLVASMIKPGVTGNELDTAAEQFIRDSGGEPGFKGLYGCPSTLLISKNEVVVHGLPDDVPLKEGDIASIDCGVRMNGFYGDAAYTFVVGEIPEETMKLLVVTKDALHMGIAAAKRNARVGDIGHAIQNYTERVHGYGVVRKLVGHGLGRELHEKPEVPNFGHKGRGPRLQDGLVIAIEPMINMGKKEVAQSKDGWSIYTVDGKPSAHFEHTIAVRNGEPDILSDHKRIEAAIEKNENLMKVSLES